MKDEVSTGRSAVLTAPLASTFFGYAIPSLVALLAMSTATLVDGVFVGHFVGNEALAAVNLLIPYFTFLFSVCLMLAIGGVVRAGKSLGEGNVADACATFTKTLTAAAVFSVVAAAIAWTFPELLFTLLGVPAALEKAALSYLHVISLALIVQLSTMVIYYFVRLDGSPARAMTALVVGALANIGLDALFILGLGWGLPGAAWATALAQLIQLSVLATHYVGRKQTLRFSLPRRGWSEVLSVAGNGASEFMTEISVGAVILALNHTMLSRHGVSGVAAFAAVHYGVFLSVMIYYGLVEALHPLVSQAFGARSLDRMQGFVRIAARSVVVTVLLFGGGVWLLGDGWLALLLASDGQGPLAQARELLATVWPVFLFSGFNLLITVYLTAVHRPGAAALIASSRMLVLPLACIAALSLWYPRASPLLALPIAEGATLVLSLLLYARHSPKRRLLDSAEAKTSLKLVTPTQPIQEHAMGAQP